MKLIIPKISKLILIQTIASTLHQASANNTDNGSIEDFFELLKHRKVNSEFDFEHQMIIDSRKFTDFVSDVESKIDVVKNEKVNVKNHKKRKKKKRKQHHLVCVVL